MLTPIMGARQISALTPNAQASADMSKKITKTLRMSNVNMVLGVNASSHQLMIGDRDSSLDRKNGGDIGVDSKGLSLELLTLGRSGKQLSKTRSANCHSSLS